MKNLLGPKQFKELYDGTDESIEGQPLRKGFGSSCEVKAIGDGTIDFIISTGAVDRDNDTINVHGWRTENFMANPVVLFGHDSRNPPVARAENVRVDGESLVAHTIFTPPDVSEFGDMVFKLYKGGFMRAVSVGFMPLDFVWSEEQMGFKFLVQELLEFSTVPVPSNPEALVLARSKGINTAPLKAWAEEVLDKWKDEPAQGVSRSQLEKVFKASNEDHKSYHHINPDKQKELRQHNVWSVRISKWVADSEDWNTEQYGPKPDERECRAPQDLLDELGVNAGTDIDDDLTEEIKHLRVDAEKLIVLRDRLVELGVDPDTLAEVTLLKDQDPSLLDKFNDLMEVHDALEIECRELKDAQGAMTIDLEGLQTVKDLVASLEAEVAEHKKTIDDMDDITEGAIATIKELRTEKAELMEALVESGVEQAKAIGPEKLLGLVARAISKRLNHITGRVD